MVKLKKIRSSTLIESIVAMVIITITMGMAFFVFSNISVKNNPQLKFKAYIEAQSTLTSAMADSIMKDDIWQKDGLQVEKRYYGYHDYDKLRVLEIRVLNNSGRTLVLRKELIKLH